MRPLLIVVCVVLTMQDDMRFNSPRSVASPQRAGAKQEASERGKGWGWQERELVVKQPT